MTYELAYYIYIIFTEHNSCTMWKMSTLKSLPQVALSCCSCAQCFPRALECRCCKLPQEGQTLQNTVVFHIEVIKRKYNRCGPKALDRKGALSATICWRMGEGKYVERPHLQRPARTPAAQMLRANSFLLPAAVSQGQRGDMHPCPEPLLCIWEVCHTPVQTVAQPVSERNRKRALFKKKKKEFKEGLPESCCASAVPPQGSPCTQYVSPVCHVET